MTLTLNQDTYNRLLVQFQPKVIETEEDYHQTRSSLLQLMTKVERSPEETALLKLLTLLLKAFDETQAKPEPASPHEILLHLMEDNQIKSSDLVGKIGSQEVVEQIFRGKSKISQPQAEALAEIFHVSASLFIR
ncbi:MAG: type II toxin-antitoxin system HigA family antitoxin [Microcystaceae cyanobacterium]